MTTWNTSESLAVKGSLLLLELGAHNIIGMMYVLVMGKDLMQRGDRRTNRFGPLRCSRFYTGSRTSSSITSRSCSALVAWDHWGSVTALRCTMPLLGFGRWRCTASRVRTSVIDDSECEVSLSWFGDPGRADSSRVISATATSTVTVLMAVTQKLCSLWPEMEQRTT